MIQILINSPNKVPHAACVAEVSIPPALTETSSWYQVWDAIDAMAWMCVRNGQVGKVSGIGNCQTALIREVLGNSYLLGDQGRIGVTIGFPEDTSSTSR